MRFDVGGDIETFVKAAETATSKCDWTEASKKWAATRERFPEEGIGYVRGGFVHLQRGEFDAADALLVDATARFGADAPTAFLYAEIATRRRDWGEARRRWSVAREAFPGLPTGYLRGAFVCAQHGDRVAAETLLAEAVERFPQDAQAAFQFAEAATGRRDWPEARRRWAAVRERFPDRPVGYLRGAFVDRHEGNFGAADALLSEAIARFPEDARLVVQHAESATERGDWSEAAIRWKTVTQRLPDEPTGFLRGAFALMQLGRLDIAEAVIVDAIRRFPDEPRFAFQYAEVATVRRDWPVASVRWAAARDRFPQVSAGYLRGAFVSEQQGDPGAAEALLREAVSRFPNEAQPAFQFAEAATQRQDWVEAGLRWAAARGRFPNVPAGLVGAGTAYLKQGCLHNAERVLSEAVARFPNDAQAAFQHAEVASRRRQGAEAWRRWSAACERFPGQITGWIGAAAAALANGDAETAARLYHRAARLTADTEAAPLSQWLMILRLCGGAGIDLDPGFVRATAEKIDSPADLSDIHQETRAILDLGQPCPEFQKKALFISGVARSGTTALVYLLNLHPKIAMFNERYTYQYGYHPELLLDSALYGDGWKEHPFALQWNLLSKKVATSTYVGDKRPNFLRSWLVTRENFSPDQIKIIHVYRRIEEIAWSFNGRAARASAGDDDGWHPSQNYKSACLDFNANNRILVEILNDKRWRDSIFVCRYSRILNDYEYCVSLLAWLGLETSRKIKRDINDYLIDARRHLYRSRSLPPAQTEYIAESVDWGLVQTILKHCR